MGVAAGRGPVKPLLRGPVLLAASVAQLAAASLVAALVAPLVAAQIAGAQQPATTPESKDPHAVQPERPTVATHAGTVAPGWLEIETGVERDHLNASTTTWATPTVFKVGVGSHAQLSILASTLRLPGQSVAFGDASVGLKWRVLDDVPVLGDFAVLPSVKLPTGSSARGAGTGTTDASLLLISSHDLGPVAMDLNAGYVRRSGNGTAAPTDATIWTASFGGPFAGPLGWVAECYGYPSTSGPAGQPSIVALLGGPTYLLRPWLAFDAGVIVPLTGPQPHALYAGLVYNVGRIWRQP